MDKDRYNKIWGRILLVLAVLGCLGTLRVMLVVPILMPVVADFDPGGPSEFRLSATPAVWVPLALTMIATLALLILKEIRIDDMGKCLSPNFEKRTPGPDLVESPIPLLDLSIDHGHVVRILRGICIRFVEGLFDKEGYGDRRIHTTGYAIRALSCLAEEGS